MAQITLKQFIQLQLIQSNEGLDDWDKEIAAVAVIAEITINELSSLTQAEFNRHYKSLSRLETPNSFEPIQSTNEWYIPKDAGDYPLRQWIAIESQVLKNEGVLERLNNNDFSDAANILALAALPTKVAMKDFVANTENRFDEWNTAEQIADRERAFMAMPAQDALGLLAFFLTVSLKRKSIFARCLQTIRVVCQQLVSNITRAMAGVLFWRG